jgi:hypothetical protein
VPLSKVYRAFPELDRFSDQECADFVARARTRGRLVLWPWATALVLGVVWWFGLRPIATWAAAAMFSERTGDLTLLAAILGFFTLAVGTTGFAAFTVRDAILRDLVRGRINTARCPACKHSLLGLPLVPGTEAESVRCPECGSVTALAMIGLSHRYLIPPSEPDSPPLWGCLPEDSFDG